MKTLESQSSWNDEDAHSLQVWQTKDLQARSVYKKVTSADGLILKELEEPLGGRP
jgi:hypothetical protein